LTTPGGNLPTLRERFPRSSKDLDLAVHAQLHRLRRAAYRGPVRRLVNYLFLTDLIESTDDFSNVSWLGKPVWQDVMDLWTIQETIHELKPSLLVETGTNQGGSSWFYAQLFDLLDHGKVITSDIERMHDLHHPRVEYLIGSSTSPEIVDVVRTAAEAATGPVMVILDSDHSRDHVAAELEVYAPLVTPGSYLLVQDGSTDTLGIFRSGRPGPLPAIEDFLRRHPEFEIDQLRCNRFLITHHPNGWLRRQSSWPSGPGSQASGLHREPSGVIDSI
jgi:cephalosporin hydroxylase